MWSYIDTEFIIVIDVLMAYNMYCVIIETKPFVFIYINHLKTWAFIQPLFNICLSFPN